MERVAHVGMPTLSQKLLRENYGRVARELLSPLLALLTEAHRAFAGDAEKFHIILILALRMAEHPEAASLDLEEVESGLCDQLPARPTNVKSIAASSGIPEETVRRKVAALVRDGYVARRGNELTYTPKAAAELSEIRRLIIRSAAHNHRTIARLRGSDEEA